MIALLLGLFLIPILAWADGNMVTDDTPILWDASPSDGLVEYRLYVASTPRGYVKGAHVAAVPWPTTEARVRDLRLTSDGQYYMAVTAAGAYGAESDFSPEVPFMRVSPAPVVDVTPPVLAILEPVHGATVPRQTSVIIRLAASDNTTLTRLVVTVNGQPTCALFAPPYDCTWKVPKAGNIRYTIDAQAMDQAGNNAHTAIEVTSK